MRRLVVDYVSARLFPNECSTRMGNRVCNPVKHPRGHKSVCPRRVLLAPRDERCSNLSRVVRVESFYKRKKPRYNSVREPLSFRRQSDNQWFRIFRKFFILRMNINGNSSNSQLNTRWRLISRPTDCFSSRIFNAITYPVSARGEHFKRLLPVSSVTRVLFAREQIWRRYDLPN